MNFISHYRGVMDRMASDNRRLTPHHVALYHALFYYWNLSRFQVPMPIARDDIMPRSRIGSGNTYHRCIRELADWGYLRYEPTFDNQSRSVVHMYRFDRGSNTGSDTGSDKGPDTTSDTTAVQEVIQPLLNSIINDKNELNNLNEIDEYEHTHKNPDQFVDWQQPDEKQNYSRGDSERESVDRNQPEKIGNKIGGGAGAGLEKIGDKVGGVPGASEEVEAYFAEQNQSAEQAARFFNYYSNLGWRLGNNGRPMEDWRFAAKNWILNIKRFDHEPELKPGALHIPRDRDYQQSL